MSLQSDSFNDASTQLKRLCEIMARLRGPEGCPWDREQTLSTLKPCLLEEAYELLESMESPNQENHAEELGDVLLQIVFQAQIRSEQGDFELSDVIKRLSDKLERRHPHVFGKAEVADSGEVLRNWEAIKRDEKKIKCSALDGVPKALPGLSRAQRVQAKASRVGFDWPDIEGPLAKVTEELQELEQELAQCSSSEAVANELGDLLFSIVNWCRFMKIDAEEALQAANNRFISRFKAVENLVRADGRQINECSLDELDKYWGIVKETQATPSQ